MSFNLQDELDSAKRYPRRQDKVLAAMHAYCTDLDIAGQDFAAAKTDHDRLLARRIVAERAAGEKSAEVAAHKAIAEDDEVYRTRLAYRLAEQRIIADRAHLARLHADLDDQRTQAADARAADSFQARSAT